MLFQRGQSYLFQANHFQFNIQESSLSIALDHVSEQRQIEFTLVRPRDLDPGKFRVVADNRATIRRKTHVKLEAIATMLKCQIERCQRIFRDGFASAGSAMTEEKRTSHRHSFLVLNPDRNRG